MSGGHLWPEGPAGARTQRQERARPDVAIARRPPSCGAPAPPALLGPAAPAALLLLRGAQLSRPLGLCICSSLCQVAFPWLLSVIRGAFFCLLFKALTPPGPLYYLTFIIPLPS